LLRLANEELKVAPNLYGNGPQDSMDTKLAVKVRDTLWKHEEILENFVSKNPAQLSADDLMIVESWRQHRHGKFILFKALKKHAIFISQDKHMDVFGVKCLYSSFEEMFGSHIPILVETTLLPFGNEIITDGLLQSYNLFFGSGIRGELKAIYDDAKERNAIITSLLPGSQIPTRESLAAKMKSVNVKVLDAFMKHQYKSGRSPKTVERDLLSISDFADFLISGQPEPGSLRDFEQEVLKKFLLSVPEKGRKAYILSTKRFLSFMRDTGRLNWDDTEELLDLVKQL
jgi:hypothetical protein